MATLEKNKLFLAVAMSSALLLTACGSDDGDNGARGVDGQAGADGKNGQTTGVLTRIATVAGGAEVTGMFITEEGDLFFNAQHPSSANIETDQNAIAYNTGTVGVIEGINFNNLPETLLDLSVPATDYQQQTVQTAYGQYKILGQTGDTFGGKLPKGLGHIYNFEGDTLIIENDMPDFNAYIPTTNNEGYLFTNWENLPGGMSRMHLRKTNGKWSVLDAEMIDFAGVKGTGANCFGSLSPWGTPLTSEEWVVYTTDTTTTDANWNNPTAVAEDARIGGMWALSDEPSNPYRFGYIIEITNPTSATPVPVKHYTIGRYEHENSTAMPDGKTVFSSQDDDGGILFKFVADTAEDLSAGTLYASKLKQDSGLSDPAVTGFDVEWIALAHSSNAQIETWIKDFDGIGTDQFVEGETSYMTLADVEAWAKWVKAGRPAGHTYPSVANGGGKQTAGKPMDDRVAFLESRQAGIALGATAEWRKLEGISINTKRVIEAVTGEDLIKDEVVKTAYLYMGNADTDKTMTDDEGDIQLLPRVRDCGTIYRAPIDSDYSISRIEPVLTGSTYRSELSGAERCDVNGLTNPDNVIVLDNGAILIGEDASGNRNNDTLWMYQPVKN